MNTVACLKSGARINAARWLVLAGLLVGFTLRVVQFPALPPGLYHDEVWNGIDALDTLAHGPRLFYTNNFGREPLYIWLVTLSTLVFGRTPWALRLPALGLGFLTLPVGYALTRALFNRRVAGWTLAVLALTVWPIQLSRVGFRAVGLPVCAGLAAFYATRGYQTRRWRYWLGAGLVYALSWYTYSAARFTLFVIGGVGVYALLTRQFPRDRRTIRQLLSALGIAALLIAPLMLYFAQHPELAVLRLQQTSLFNRAIFPEGPLRAFATSLAHTLGMFNLRGDFQLRHNIPNRPVFELGLGVMFLLGVFQSVRQARRGATPHAFVLLWVAVMVVPTLISYGAPHFLRAAGVWPILAILPALGLDWLWMWGSAQRQRRWVGLWLTLIISGSLTTTVTDYFFHYPQLTELNYWFENAGVELAHEVNTFLEYGWTRDAIYPATSAHPERQVYIDFQLWKDWLNASYLIPPSAQCIVPQTHDRDGPITHAALPTLLFSWRHPDYPGWWLPQMAWLPTPARLALHLGPQTTTNMEARLHPAYIAFTATPYTLTPPLLGDFAVGPDLVGGNVAWEETGIHAHLEWTTAQPLPTDYTPFLHVECAGQIVAQHDAPPWAACPDLPSCFPMTAWRPGDILLDEVSLAVPPTVAPAACQVWVGTYHWPELERIPVASPTHKVQDYRLRLFP